MANGSYLDEMRQLERNVLSHFDAHSEEASVSYMDELMVLVSNNLIDIGGESTISIPTMVTDQIHTVDSSVADVSASKSNTTTKTSVFNHLEHLKPEEEDREIIDSTTLEVATAASDKASEYIDTANAATAVDQAQGVVPTQDDGRTQQGESTTTFVSNKTIKPCDRLVESTSTTAMITCGDKRTTLSDSLPPIHGKSTAEQQLVNFTEVKQGSNHQRKPYCTNCRAAGHLNLWCPFVACHRCGDSGHMQRACRANESSKRLPVEHVGRIAESTGFQGHQNRSNNEKMEKTKKVQCTRCQALGHTAETCRWVATGGYSSHPVKKAGRLEGKRQNTGNQAAKNRRNHKLPETTAIQATKMPGINHLPTMRRKETSTTEEAKAEEDGPEYGNAYHNIAVRERFKLPKTVSTNNRGQTVAGQQPQLDSGKASGSMDGWIEMEPYGRGTSHPPSRYAAEARPAPATSPKKKEARSGKAVDEASDLMTFD